MLNRAIALLEVRELQEEARTFEGWATTPTPDRLGDEIDPKGARFTNPLPLLHQHDSTQPIGTAKLKRATPEGIAFTATIPKVSEPGPLKDRLDTAWGEIKNGLVRAVSIGFRVLKDGIERTAQGDGLRFTAIEIVELSAVSVPANAEATITNIRNLDQQRAASGTALQASTLPGVAGSQQPNKGARAMPRTISEQIEDFTKSRAVKVTRQGVIMQAAGERGETLDAAESEEFDSLQAEIDTVDGHLKRLVAHERTLAASAAPVISSTISVGEVSPHAAAAAQRVEPQPVRAAERVAPGIRMARVARTLALAKMNGRDPILLAVEQYQRDEGVVELVKATVAAASTQDPTWAGALVGFAGEIVADFVAYLRPMTILGQFGQGGVPDLRRVPFRAALVGQTSGGQGYWVGEGKAKPLTKFDFVRNRLFPLKVATISVLDREVVRDSSPQAEVLVRDALTEALTARLDTDFVDPAKAAVANVSPASVTNGVAGIPSTGTDAASTRADIKAAYAAYTAGNNQLSGGVWIMPADLAASLGMMRNLLGQPEFPGVSRSGGVLEGFPVIPSNYAPADTAILLNARETYLADEGGFRVDMSMEASLEMSDAPIGSAVNPVTPSPPTTTLVSLWQTNCVGLLAERTINWMKRRPEACVILTGVKWGDVGP
jgi:HK97 family phage major capsid protein/HK97 family phage prohead protease